MGRLRHRPPKYSRYRKTQARTKFNGQDIYLGRYDSIESHEAFNRVVAQWSAQRSGDFAKKVDETLPAGCVTVARCVLEFAHSIRDRYRTRSGRDTGTRANYRQTLRLLNRLYGSTPAEQFGAVKLKAFRAKLIERGLARKTINDHVARIKRIFKFAASEELISESIPAKHATVEGLRQGESSAAESVPVGQVADAIVDQTLPYLPAPVAAMVRLQRLTAARPGEIVQMRPCDVDRSREPWEYVPREHKTEHHGKSRVIMIGAEAQAVLRPFLLRGTEEECFSPLEVWKGRNWREGRRRKPGTRYSVQAYRRAIVRGCEKAFGMPKELRRAPRNESPDQKAAREAAAAAWRAEHAWHPHQLRHTAATAIKQKFGDEAARVTLGHSSVKTTAIYAERDLNLARQVARETG